MVWMGLEARPVNDHPNRHIREAIDYALQRGWRLKKAGPRAHIWGRLFCPQSDREGCMISVFSTPRSPEEHAMWLRHKVDRCRHG
jgi:hypothetical protein